MSESHLELVQEVTRVVPWTIIKSYGDVSFVDTVIDADPAILDVSYSSPCYRGGISSAWLLISIAAWPVTQLAIRRLAVVDA